MVSSVAIGSDGAIYEIQRGERANAVLVFNGEGSQTPVVHSTEPRTSRLHPTGICSSRTGTATPGFWNTPPMAGDALWASTQPLDQPPGSAGWVVELGRHSGRIMGHLEMPEALAGHGIEISPSGEPVATLGNQLLWFRRDAD
jgi:hypothetical protein